MDNLITVYYKREEKPTELSRFMESTTELLQFIIDSIKKIPDKELQVYESQPDKSLLMHSPTHAFLLKPGYQKLKKGWETESYTYTYIRDEWIKPIKEFTSHLMLDKGMMEQLNESISKRIPEQFRMTFYKHLFSLPNRLNPVDYRNLVIEIMTIPKGLQLIPQGWLSKDDIDSVLYESLPFFPSYKLKEGIAEIFDKIDPDKKTAAIELYDQYLPRSMSDEFLAANRLKEIALALLILIYKKTALPYDAASKIAQASRDAGYAIPEPIIFADTNWMRDYFGVTVNPGTGNSELWRFDYTGTKGAPMSSWKHWLDGSRRKPDWGIFNRYFEYTPESDLQ